MLSTLSAAYRWTPLPDFGAVRVQGADSVRFLQGQLSNDVQKLTAVNAMLAGLHTPQGRAVALLRLIKMGPDDVLAVLPRELAPAVAARLSKFVLRAKAKVTDASADWRFTGLIAPPEARTNADGLPTGSPADASASAATLPAAMHGQAEIDSSFVVRVADAPARWLVATPVAMRSPATDRAVTDVESWRAFDIAAGLPQVYAATSEAFVAQMLNLDVLNAIAFEKGCYTGQEVIARAHYRGRVKRRMQRFRSVGSATLAIGDSGKFRDGRSFRVVDVVALSDGRCEFLAVAPVSSGEDDAAEPATASTSAVAEAASLDVESLPLPYALPV